MSEFVERVKVDEIVLDDPGEPCEDAFSPMKLMGVAAAGAVAALAAYYAWAQLEPEKRTALKDSILSAARSQMRVWSEGDEVS